jgi:hypothetical protein
MSIVVEITVGAIPSSITRGTAGTLKPMGIVRAAGVA